ncbi:MAG: regulatory signaling modulator protein AmpE, partial [Pseudohongiellaceae bacterium]
VVLIVIFLYRNWTGGNPLRGVIPLSGYLRVLKTYVSAATLRFVLAVAVPVVLVILIASAINHWLMGLVWLLFALFILAYSIEVHETDLVFDDQAQWLRSLGEEDSLVECRQRQQDFRLLTTYAVFQSLYPALFWFIVFGPAGAVLYIVTRQYVEAVEDESESSLADRTLHWLEWPAIRVTGLIFALLGHFGNCFERWLESLSDMRQHAGGLVLGQLADAATNGAEKLDIAPDMQTFAARSEGANVALRQLLDRTPFGWLGLAAIVTIMGY